MSADTFNPKTRGEFKLAAPRLPDVDAGQILYAAGVQSQEPRRTVFSTQQHPKVQALVADGGHGHDHEFRPRRLLRNSI